MSSFLDLPDELILKVFTYTETVDLLSCAQVSKRIRTISFDNSLLQTVNLRNVNVKTDLLATLLNKGCKSLKLSDCSLLGDLTLIPKSQLKILDYRNCRILAYSQTIRYKNKWQVVNKNSQKLQKKVDQPSDYDFTNEDQRNPSINKTVIYAEYRKNTQIKNCYLNTCFE